MVLEGLCHSVPRLRMGIQISCSLFICCWHQYGNRERSQQNGVRCGGAKELEDKTVLVNGESLPEPTGLLGPLIHRCVSSRWEGQDEMVAQVPQLPGTQTPKAHENKERVRG